MAYASFIIFTNSSDIDDDGTGAKCILHFIARPKKTGEKTHDNQFEISMKRGSRGTANSDFIPLYLPLK